ncbi:MULTISPECIES: alanine racemase [Acidobacteriaceae]|uniref:alanine racemase n=1 Tax=Acidobacteriaceae TaxID=204434 RepID=UPI00131B4527|nr:MULTISPECIES: alanine racemase [Acidobacteriaceae]MDW5265559.1 alanine racemase [Edaphobacter sp.]
MKSWVEISEERLLANYAALARVAGDDVAVMAVIKADAYGHGAKVCAPVLANAGVEWLGVTDAEEGVAVRASLAGVAAEQQPKILVMSGLLEEDAEAVVHHGLTPVVWTWQQMEWLAEAVARQGAEPLALHLEIDTGMARQGVAPGDELLELLTWLAAQPSLRLDGVMTHFASAEVADSPLTLKQRERFEQAMAEVAASGLRPVWVHAGNSSTVDNSAVSENDRGSLVWLREVASSAGGGAMVRTGIALYGYCLPVEGGEAMVEPELRPVMAWKTRVIGVREVEAGDTVGYNAVFTAQRPMRLALLPVGYADGLRRELSGSDAATGGWVMIGGQRAMIVGRVSMNLTMVDVTEISGVSVGDEVVLLGDGMTADDHARLAHTIAYEIVCGMRAASRLVKRDKGEIQGSLHSAALRSR